MPAKLPRGIIFKSYANCVICRDPCFNGSPLVCSDCIYAIARYGKDC